MPSAQDQDPKRQRRAAKEVAAAYTHLHESATKFAEALAHYDAERDMSTSDDPETGPHRYTGAAIIGILGAVVDAIRNYIEGQIDLPAGVTVR